MIKGDIVLTSCYPDTEQKLLLLESHLRSIKNAGYEAALASHYFFTEPQITNLIDYFIYEKYMAMSENYTVYYYFNTDELRLTTKRSDAYHALSGWMNVKNAATALFNKYERIHYIQYDTIADIKPYISFAKEKLSFRTLLDAKLKIPYGFVGSKYSVPKQNLNGIVSTIFSFDVNWFEHIQEINTWDEYKRLGRDEGDNLLGENWLYNYFEDENLLDSCYFMTQEEFDSFVLKQKVQVVGDAEPGLVVKVSMLDDGRYILFIHLYAGGELEYSLNTQNMEKADSAWSETHHKISGGQIHWVVMDGKFVNVSVLTTHQSIEFTLGGKWNTRFPCRLQPKDTLDTTFEFADGRFKCKAEHYRGRG